MTPRDPSDALVFFGMSGDLAHKKIFPALYAMVKKGELDVPVIGVASSQWTVDDLRNRARDSITEYGGGVDDEDAFEQLTGLLRYVDGDYNDASTFTELKKALGELRASRALPRDPAEHVRDGGRGPRVVGLRRERARDRREAVRARPRVGAGAQPGPALGVPRAGHLPDRPLPRARRRPRTSSTSGSPTRSSSRSGTATTCARCRSRWPRTSACRAAASSTRRSARCATSSRTTCSRRSALLAMEPPVGPGVEELRDGKERVFAAMETLKPDDLVRGQFEGYRDEDGVAPDSDVETFAAVRAAHRLVALGGRAVLRPRRQEPAGHVHRGAGRAAPSAASGVRRVRAAAARHQLLPVPVQPAHRDRDRACG